MRLDLPRGQQVRLQAKARLRSIRLANETRFALHPWPFLRDVVYTLDQQAAGRGEGTGIRKYPGDAVRDPQPRCACGPQGCVNYLEHMVNVWFVAGERIAFPKSRRLLVSWTMIACHYWLARYVPNGLIAIGARKQGQHEGEGSAELVKRFKIIHDNLPAEVLPRPVGYSYCRFRFQDNGSEVVGIAQGADQARQYTFTAYLADEFAYWERAGETYAAALPTLEGGGRFTAVSTANPSYMEQLVYDQWHGSMEG